MPKAARGAFDRLRQEASTAAAARRAAAAVQAPFEYSTGGGTVTITKYTGLGGAVSIPGTINGLPVTSIGEAAFSGCTSLDEIVVDALNSSYSSVDGVVFDRNQTTLIQSPGGKATASSTSRGRGGVGGQLAGAFAGCRSLAAVYFEGNAPGLGPAVFDGADNVTAYHLPGTTD